MEKKILMALLLGCVLLPGCVTSSSLPSAPGSCPQLSPAPADVMHPRQATFLRRMETLLYD
ncbi:hypothetical protein DFR38_10523 [Aquitalea magnusonii]|uniref:Lipoprotein n=1 Tax=Aquitalea magnusonii TaxID=332411 RepID=A0A318JIR2_9NEIS|nr:hypothetical protein DFR38_10523 [Aquitalea magnusonii]